MWTRTAHAGASICEELNDLASSFLGCLGEVDLVWDDFWDKLLGKVETVLGQIRDNDGLSTCCCRADELHDTDWASSSDWNQDESENEICQLCDSEKQESRSSAPCKRPLTQDWVSQTNVSSVCSAENDTQRLQESNFRESHCIWDLVEPSCWVHVVSRQSSIHGWDRVEVDDWAQVVLTCSAVGASDFSARNTWLNGDFVTDLDVSDTWTNSDDYTSRLVAQGSLVSDGPWAKTSVLPEMNVTSADTESEKEDKETESIVSGCMASSTQ